MSNSISMTLPKEQAGIGMGLLSMLNFISGGIASGVYGRLVDVGSSFSWNPVNRYLDGTIYSNIFLVLAVVHMIMLIFYYYQFGRTKTTIGGEPHDSRIVKTGTP